MSLLKKVEPISKVEFRQLLSKVLNLLPEKLGESQKIGVGLSGGVDSATLLSLLQEAFGPERIVAITVDHRLRTESTDEAKRVKSWAMENGLLHHETLTLNWNDGDFKDGSSVMLIAREKRLKSIYFKCKEMGIPVLFLAHHLMDDVVTSFFRIGKASQLEGLGGMKYVSTMPIQDLNSREIVMAKPLLSIEKERIYATAKDRGIKWVEDPSNQKIEYLRNIANEGWKEAMFINPNITYDRIRDFMSFNKDLRVKAISNAAAFLDSNALIELKLGFAVSFIDQKWLQNQYNTDRALKHLLFITTGVLTTPKHGVVCNIRNACLKFWEDFKNESSLSFRCRKNISASGGGAVIKPISWRFLSLFLKDMSQRKGEGMSYRNFEGLAVGVYKTNSFRKVQFMVLNLKPGEIYNHDSRFWISYKRHPSNTGVVGSEDEPVTFRVESMTINQIRLFIERNPDHSKKVTLGNILMRIPSSELGSYPVLSCPELGYVCFPTFGIDGPENLFQFESFFIGKIRMESRFKYAY